MKFYVPETATEAALESGAPLERGTEVNLPDIENEAHNLRLLVDGQIMPVSKKGEELKEKAPNILEKLEADRLRKATEAQEPTNPEEGGESQ